MGTALLSVLLTNATTDRVEELGRAAPPQEGLVAQADPFGATFWWALALLAVTFLTALLLPRGQSRPPEDPDEQPTKERVPVAD